MTGLCGFVSSLCTASAHHISSVSTASNIRYTPSFHTQDPKVVSLNHDSYGFTYDKVVGTYCSWSVTYSVGSIVFKYLPLVALYSDFIVRLYLNAQSMRTAGYWMMPWVMQSIDTRIVNRSNALSGWRYGRNLVYREYSQAPNVLVAMFVSAVFPIVGALLYFSLTRCESRSDIFLLYSDSLFCLVLSCSVLFGLHSTTN